MDAQGEYVLSSSWPSAKLLSSCPRDTSGGPHQLDRIEVLYWGAIRKTDPRKTKTFWCTQFYTPGGYSAVDSHFGALWLAWTYSPRQYYYVSIMATERIRRQIDRLLDEAEEAVTSQDWTTVGDRAQSVLRLDPGNEDALSYLGAAERDLPPITPPAAGTISQRPSTADVTSPGTETDLSRTRLEQYIPRELLAKLQGARTKGVGSGERRVVTMLFCDVTGSTSAASTLDPEEWAEIMNGAFEHLISPIYRYEGTLARLMGDAILAFFGAPISHEDDPQRAVLAGLDIVQGIGAYQAEVKSKWNLDFGVRVGINTGLVVVGEVGSDTRVEYTAMGDAINLAARMEQTAQSGTVQVAADTYNLIAPLFDFENLGEIEVKGKDDPVSAYRVIGPKAVPGRLRGIEGLSSPLIGRDSEFSALRQVLAKLYQGSGGIVCLMGETGIGKSRLLDELETEWEKIAGSGSPWIISQGVSYDTTRPYGLFMQSMRHVYGIEENDPPELIREKVERTPDAFPPEVKMLVVRVVGALLAVGADSDGPQLHGEALKQELHQACQNVLRASASLAPTVMLLDDLHRADPASVELMIEIFPLVEELPLLMLCSFRPERQSPAWRMKQTAETDYPHRYTEISLGALTDENSSLLFGNLLSIVDSRPQLSQMILAKTGGNPLFVEEFIRTLIDTGDITRDESGMHWTPDTEVADIPIPENLLALITSRIDRLEEDTRRTLQLSSVIGRSFYHRVIKLNSDSSIALDKELNTLQRAELIREAGRVPEVEYIFRHDLTREAAYNSILLRERREFHRNVGEAVEELFTDRLEEQSHLLAHHFSQAEDAERAMKYSAMAGDLAARLYANDEATTHYTRAIELARQGYSSNQQLIDLYMARGRAQEVSGLYDGALSGYVELEELGRERKDAALELAALTANATLHSTINALPDIEKARVLSERSLDLAQQLKDHSSEARALWNHMLIEILAGDDYYKAMEYGEQSLRIARQHNLVEQIAYTSQDIARAYFAIGQFAKGREAMEEARESWRNLDNMPMLADNLVTSALALHAAGLVAEGGELVEEALDISRSIGSLYLEAFALGVNAQGHVERGDIDQALVAIEDGIAKAVAANNEGLSGLLHATSAAVYGLLGASDRGLEQALIALDLANTWQRPFFLIPLALAHLSNGHLPEAEAALQPSYDDSRMESKRNMEYIGAISALPDLLRSELALAMKEYERVLSYTRETQERATEGRKHIFLPDILRIEGQALLALGRVTEAWTALANARAAAEAQGSRRALWSILFEMAKVASLEGNHHESERLLDQSRETLNYIADHCGSSELRNAFLNFSQARNLLGTGCCSSAEGDD